MFKRIVSFIMVCLLLTGTLVVTVGARKKEEFESVNTEELAKQVIDAVSGMEHPYMMYSKEEIPALKKKIESGMSERAFKKMKATANSFLGIGLPGHIDVGGRMMQHYVAVLGITGMLTGENRYTDKAIDLVMKCIEADYDCIPKDNAVSADLQGYGLGAADYAHMYALAYDLLYERMTDEQRVTLRATVERFGKWIYEMSPISPWGENNENRMAWNWSAVTHGALGMCAMALGDKPEWLQLALDRTLGYYRYAVDSTGAAMEGLHYIGHGLNTLTPFDHAVYRLTEFELMDSCPGIQQLPYWSMYMTLPTGGGQVAIGQGNIIDAYSTTYYIINRYKQSDALWGWENTYNLSDNTGFREEAPRNGWSMPAIILFEDQSLKPVEPTSENNPLIKTFEKGVVIARDSWEKDASMATFTCGYGYQGCWNHPDDNSFTFYAKGESFVIDLGAGHLNSSDHNVVLADGQGMDYVGGSTMREGKMKINQILENGALYLCGNNQSSYLNLGFSVSIRQFVYSGGDTPYVIIFDYAKKYGTVTYSTNFYTKSGNIVKIAEDGSYATIEGGANHELCYVFAYTPEGVTFSKRTFNITMPGVNTSSTSDCHTQATVFITANSDGSAPKVEITSEGRITKVTITRIENGETVTDTYEFENNKIASPSVATTEKPTEAPTETNEPTETESVETVESSATEIDSVETESGLVETEEIPNIKKSGCQSSLNMMIVIPAISATVFFASRKEDKSKKAK